MLLNKPDMHKECADKLLGLAKEAHTVLEWGSGGSTVAMSKIMLFGSSLYSYEHDKRFYEMIKHKLDKDKVTYVFAEADDYVYKPLSNIHYSFILVDGIMRKECLKQARNNLSWDLLLLHDAEREEYKPWMDKFDDKKYKKSFVRNLWMCERRV